MTIFQVHKCPFVEHKYSIAISTTDGWMFFLQRTEQFEWRGWRIYEPPNDVIIFEDEQ